MAKRTFGFTTMLLSTLAFSGLSQEEAVIAVQEARFVDPTLYEKHLLDLDLYDPFDKVPPLLKNVPLSDDKVFTTLNFQPGLTYNV